MFEIDQYQLRCDKIIHIDFMASFSIFFSSYPVHMSITILDIQENQSIRYLVQSVRYPIDRPI